LALRENGHEIAENWKLIPMPFEHKKWRNWIASLRSQ